MTATATPVKADPDTFRIKASDILARLYERWQDEKEYENIKDYIVPFQPLAEATGIVLVKMKSRPFELHYSCEQANKNYRLIAKLVKGGRQLSIECYSTLIKKPV